MADGRALTVIGPTGTWPVDEPGGLLPKPSSDAGDDGAGALAAADAWPPSALRRWVGIVLVLGAIGPLVAVGRLLSEPDPLTTPTFWLVLALNAAMLAAGTVSVRRGQRSFRYALADLAVLLSVAVTTPAAAIFAAALARGATLARDYTVHADERPRLLFNFGSGMVGASVAVVVVSSLHPLPWNYLLASLAASLATEYAFWRCYRLTFRLRLSRRVLATGVLRLVIPVLVALVVGLLLLLPLGDYVVVLVPTAAAVVWKLAYELSDLRSERAAWDRLDEHNASLLGERNEVEVVRRAAANAVRIFPITECRLAVYPTARQGDGSGHLVRAGDSGDVAVEPLPTGGAMQRAGDASRVTATEAVGVLTAASRVLGHCELYFESHQRHRRELARVFAQFLSATASTLMLARQHDSMRSYAESKAREAEQDQLTLLGNRTKLYRGGARALHRARTRGRHASLIMFDLDGFKRINDTLGHAVGDEVLKVVAGRVRGLAGPADVAARVGGDEFVVLAADLVGPEQALGYAESIADTVSRTVPVEGIQLAVEASVGIAHAQKGIGVSELLKRADIALYEAKVNQSGHPEVFEPRMAQHTPEQLLLTVDLRAALGRAEAAQAVTDQASAARQRARAGLVLHYQPQVDLDRGMVVGAEALVRWQHPIHGLLHPEVFVPLAEQTGMITAFTSQVLEQALQDYVELRDRLGGRPGAFTVSVNLSVRNLLDLSLPEHVARRLAHHGVPADQVVIEVTESANVHDWASAERVMQALADLGCRVSIDDFGTGYSSLQSLLQRQGTIRELKVDRSFVLDITRARPGQTSVVQAIIHMAHGTGCLVVAEGVESVEAVRLLREMGCDIGQGYWFARPMPLHALSDWARQWPERWAAEGGCEPG